MSAQIAVLRPRKEVRVRTKVLTLLPQPVPGRTWLYAISFRGGRTKIGITSAPRRRLFELWNDSGLYLDWLHLFGSVDSAVARKWERGALTLAGIVARRNGRAETFGGLSREAAIRCGRGALYIVQRRAG